MPGPLTGMTVIEVSAFIAAPYAGVIEFCGDKISGWRDYVDRGTIDRQKAGEGWPEHVRELVGRPAQ